MHKWAWLTWFVLVQQPVMSSSTAVIAVVLLLMDVTARSTLLSGAQSECVIRPNKNIRLSLEAGLEHSCSVVVDDAWKPSDPLGSTSAVVFQLHAQRANVSLRFDGCKEVVGCGPAPAPHVGLLKPLSANNSVHAFNFNLSCVCLHGGACNGSGGVTSGGNGNDDGCCCGSGEKINVLVAAVPLLSYAPIPGGCGLTSTLEQDPNTYVSYSRDVTTVTFQSGDVGFDPSSGQTIPVCDSGPDPPFKQMNYSLYKRFLPMRSFSEDDMFDALEEMLTAMTVESSNKLTRKTLKYSDNKMVRVSSMPGQGVVYNVIAEYTSSGEYYNNNNNNNYYYYQSTAYSSAYVPFVSYGCDLRDEEGGGGCVGLFSYGDYAIAGVVAALGLLLCFFAQAKPQMFHFEMLALNFIIWLFIWYVVLGATTSWSHTVELGAIVGLSVAMAIVLYGLWSAVGLTLAHLMWFSSVGGFLIAATLLFTPVGELYWLGYGYIYALVLLCGMTLVLVPLVLFPRFMNIVTTALIGSYCVVFFVGLFTYSSLNEIVLRVARTAANPDLLEAVNDYPFEIIDVGLSGLWFLLFVSSVAVQSLLSKWDEKRSKAKHRGSKYSPFPLHPCKAVRNRRSLSRRQQQQQQRQRQQRNHRSEDARDSERRPLLSPAATQQYHAPPPPPPARAQQRAQFVQVVQQEGQMDGVQYREVTYRMVSATN